MIFRHRVPRPPLDSFIASIWICRNEPQPFALERILPTGAAQLILNLKESQTRLYDPNSLRCTTTEGSVLSGVRSRYQIIDTAEQEYVAGVAFKPGGTVAVMRLPANEASNVDVPLDVLWRPDRANALRERLLESGTPDEALDAIEDALEEMLLPRGMHPAVAFALASFNRGPQIATIAAVTDAIALSAKRFIERFKVEVGVTPKRYCRIRRFQRALALAHRGRSVDWTRVALDCGYFDQAHFIHDFRAFSGLTPTAYQAARTPFQNHVKFLQSSGDAI